MLSKANRLKKSSDFDKVYKKGEHFKGVFGVLIILPRESEASVTRIGIVVPGKLGDAVHRNKAKRQIREVFSGLQDNLPSGVDISFICWTLDFDYNKIKKDIEKLLGRYNNKNKSKS